MGDVAQILSGKMGGSAAQGSSSAPPPPPPPPPPSHHPSRAMKMTGMSREVMDLMAGNQDLKSAALPPMVPTIPPAKDLTVKVGNKFISANKPAKKWVWAPFASSARTDGALFRHWVRGGVEYPDYPYARFDVHLDPVTYSVEEYNRFLVNDEWTKNETDKLVDLARVHELRWAVVYDRWCDFYPPRKVEELQHRYYSIAAALLQQRVAKEAASEVAALSTTVPVMDPTLPPEEQKAVADQHLMETAAARALASAQPQHQPLMHNISTGSSNKNAFDLAKERERRAHLQVIWHRTKEEEEEETELRKELRLVEAQIRKLKKSGGHILAASQQQRAGISSALSSQNPSRSVSPVPASSIDAGLLDQCFASTAPTPVRGTPYLQSGRLVAPAAGGPMGINKTTLKRLDTVMEELNIPQRPMPTKRVCDLYDSVRKNALTLITLQKMVIQKEAQLQNKRLRLAKMGGGGRVVDEEALLGIAPPPATPAAPAAAASRQKSTGSKTKKTTKPKPIKTATVGEAGKVNIASAASGNVAVKAVPGKSAPGKQGRKAGTKRKKKSEKTTTAASTAIQAGAAAAGGGRDAAAKGASADTAKPPTKKRARKN